MPPQFEQFRKASGEAAGRNGRNGKAPDNPADRVPAIEKMLLTALLESAEARAEVLPRLRDLPAARRFVTWNILEALMAAAEQGEVTYSDVEARLNEADRTLLPRILLADNKTGDGRGFEQALACLRTIEGESLKQRISALKDEVRAAERAGDLATAARAERKSCAGWNAVENYGRTAWCTLWGIGDWYKGRQWQLKKNSAA